MDARFKSILESQQRTVTVLSSLIAVQEAVGYLPPESISAVAEFTGASVNEVWGVATFYSHFRFQPAGEHVIELCWGPSCQLFNSKRMMETVERRTGAKFGETTADKKFTLRGSECSGACALAPVGKFDGVLTGRLTEAQLEKTLDALGAKQGAVATGAKHG